MSFKLPEHPGGRDWVCLLDANRPDLVSMPRYQFNHAVETAGWSLLFFMLRPEPAGEATADAEMSFQHVIGALMTSAGQKMD